MSQDVEKLGFSSEYDEIVDQYEKKIFDLKQLLEISRSLCSTVEFSQLIESILYTCMGQFRVLGAGVFVLEALDSDAFMLDRNYNGLELDPQIEYKIPTNNPLIQVITKSDRVFTLAELENEVDGIEVGSIGDKVFYAKWEDHTLDEHCTCTVCGNEYHSFDENGVCTVCGEIEHTVDIWTGEIAEGFAGGTGTSSDPYIIESGSEFAYLSSLVSDGNALNDIYFELESDVDLNSIEWEPIGSDDSHPFSGVFDGNGHAITNMKVEGGFKGRVGLFGSLKDAVVKDLAIENASVSLDYYSESYFAGGIVAGTTYYANIINVYASGSLDVQLTSSTSAAFAGGIVGYAGNSYLTDCESDVTVRCITKTSNGWHAYSGGICGGLQGPCTFTNCFAKCNLYAESVSNRGYAGGIVGVSGASSTIQNCAVIGDIKSDSDGYVSGIYCYWSSSDISVYNSYYATTLSNGTVRTYGTAVDASCFTSLEWCIENLHWDFDEVWEMGETYPQLKTFKRQFYSKY